MGGRMPRWLAWAVRWMVVLVIEYEYKRKNGVCVMKLVVEELLGGIWWVNYVDQQMSRKFHLFSKLQCAWAPATSGTIGSFSYKVKVLDAQSYLTLCEPMDCSPRGFSVCGILQGRVLEWVAISFSRRSSWPRDQTCISCIAGRFLLEPPGKPHSHTMW